MPDIDPRLAAVGIGYQEEGPRWAALMSLEAAQVDHRIGDRQVTGVC